MTRTNQISARRVQSVVLRAGKLRASEEARRSRPVAELAADVEALLGGDEFAKMQRDARSWASLDGDVRELAMLMQRRMGMATTKNADVDALMAKAVSGVHEISKKLDRGGDVRLMAADVANALAVLASAFS